MNNPGMQPCSATTVEYACIRWQCQARVRHMFWQRQNPKAGWSRRLRCMQVSLCWWLVNCCVQVCKQTQRNTQGTKRAKCAHVGDTNNTQHTGFSKLEIGSTSRLVFLECLRTRSTNWDRNYFEVPRKHLSSQPSHVCCVGNSRRMQAGREIVKVRLETASVAVDGLTIKNTVHEPSAGVGNGITNCEEKVASSKVPKNLDETE